MQLSIGGGGHGDGKGQQVIPHLTFTKFSRENVHELSIDDLCKY